MTARSHTAAELDAAHLRRALDLAAGGRGAVAPNPLVGAVLARGEQVIGEGHHAQLGGRHAEVAAIEDARQRGEDPAGSTLYVTLEPCAHHGRQPPCTDAILAAGIPRVVVASEDPTEKASGRGPGILRDEGVEVAFAEGAEAAEARLLNQPFRKRARTGKPLVVHKAAMSLDGATATASGDSKWISGPESRALVHRWRAESGAVAVGIGTALADDPLLTARDVDAVRQPVRVVFDREARLPPESNLVRSVSDAPVIVVHGGAAPAERVSALGDVGVETLAADALDAALAELGRREIDSLMLEGGATLAGALLAAGEIDQMRLFVAPLILGGGRPLFAGGGASGVSQALQPLEVKHEAVGPDLLLSVRLREW